MEERKHPKLDPFAERLEKWLMPEDADGEGVSVAEGVERLRKEGCETTPEELSDWWKQRLEQIILSGIAGAAGKIKMIEAAFAKYPAPELDILLKLYRVWILNVLDMSKLPGKFQPDYLNLADRLTKTLLGYAGSQKRAELKERELALAEHIAAEAMKSDEERALALCVDKAAGWPDVQEMFRAAFEALERRRNEEC